MIADTTSDVITATSNTRKYPPTYGDLFPYVIERGGTSPDGVEMRLIRALAGDEHRHSGWGRGYSSAGTAKPVIPCDRTEARETNCFRRFATEAAKV